MSSLVLRGIQLCRLDFSRSSLLQAFRCCNVFEFVQLAKKYTVHYLLLKLNTFCKPHRYSHNFLPLPWWLSRCSMRNKHCAGLFNDFPPGYLQIPPSLNLLAYRDQHLTGTADTLHLSQAFTSLKKWRLWSTTCFMSWQDPISGTPSLHKCACCANSEHLLPSPGSKPLTSAALDALPAPCPHSLTPGIFHLCYFSCSAVCLSSRVGPSYKRDLTIFRPLARSLGLYTAQLNHSMHSFLSRGKV